MSRLGNRLRRHARETPDARAVHAGERWWSYRELVSAAEALALDVGPGDVVAVAIDRGIEAVLGVCGAALAGAIPAMVDPGDRELAARTLARLRPAVVATARGDDDLPGARVVEPDGRPARPAAALAWDPARRAARTAHILFTSGSTADGKAVAWSELRAGHDWRITRPPRVARGRPSAIVAPLCSSLGYHELARSLCHGTSVALLDAPFPAAIAQADSLGVDRVKLTPTHVELLLATAEELPHLRVVAVTSAPIAPDRLRTLAARLPAARICRSYGLTESGTATMVWLHRKPGKLHTVGRPVGYRRVTVRDEAGRMLPPGRTGEVVIELPMWDRADGYLDAPPELARRFENGALWTGDRGKIDRHGFLVLTSRNAEILKVGGRSVAALRIEEAIAALPEVAEVVVVGVPDRLLGEVPCAVFVPAGGGRRLEEDGPDLIDVRPDEQPRWFLARRDLPRGPSGKIRRGQLAQEAARWTRWFDQAIVPDHRLYPAHAPVEGVAVVDGCPAEWKGDGGALDPAARIVTLVEREPLRPLALAIVQAGATGVGGEVRFIVGPHPIASAAGRATADVLDLFAAELVAMTGRLPGPRPELTCAFAAEHVRAYAGAGFVAVPQRAGWMTRAERSAEDAHGPIGAAPGVVLEAALDEVAAAWPRLAR
jgi:acyl-coenzyme A synthetase/AMP-(fatty) acid ligase